MERGDRTGIVQPRVKNRQCLANPQPMFFKSGFNDLSPRVTLPVLCVLRLTLWTVAQSTPTPEVALALLRHDASLAVDSCPPRP
ncbi:hypothetical protein SAMN04487857_101529 [Pseudomonas sp. ok272]|nr:hypothetical protein SAMN04487857_101529 [Pseudomonas sp. ok272]SFN31977.1 hypothetical protein SAMN04487858_11962 [Pseudomonas sp. ok602]